jgi:hypothetical protein
VLTKPKATWTATLGLVVHAAADGIALGKALNVFSNGHECRRVGAASATSRFNVELIVFMAIMLHKVRLPRLIDVCSSKRAIPFSRLLLRSVSFHF